MRQHIEQNPHCLTIISANVRGLLTNIGDLTHSFVVPNGVDIVAAVETFFDDKVPQNYGRISGYSNWHRRDRVVREKGGIAVCFRNSLHVQPLDVDIPEHLEISFFRIWMNDNDTILFCTCYRPQWQRTEPIDFLHHNLDGLLYEYSCKHLVIVGDMNQNQIAVPFEDFLNIFGLINHVNFPTHDSGSSLDPVITDFSDSLVYCCPLGNVGSSDHQAVYTSIDIRTSHDSAVTRTTWLWEQGDWLGLRKSLEEVEWNEVLVGHVNKQAEAFANIILEKQRIFIPHRTYTVKPKDQPWFGYQCRVAADEKSRAWNNYKQNPTRRKKQLHTETCKRMKRVQQWAMRRWQEDLKTKLTERPTGSKDWWNIIKQQQGLVEEDSIPPLTRPDGSVAIDSIDKAELLASFFASKMTVPDPDCSPPKLPSRTNARLSTLRTNMHEVERHLRDIDVKKALGPDNISPYILKKCASQLAAPLAHIFNACIDQQAWPKQWKWARVVAIHKKNSRNCVNNYRPISLLSITGKIYEKIICKRLTDHLEKHHLLSLKQFGFRKERSTADLLLKMSSAWNKSLDKREDIYVMALDIAGAFDRVWHAGLISKIKSLGIDGNLLELISNYLQDRIFHVAVNGCSSSEYEIKASVPQGSVLGPLFWNIYFDDILHLIPEACAFADDCTLNFVCKNDDHHYTIRHINETLRSIVSWGKKWQVTLAPEKTQLMVISRRPRPPNLPNVKLEGKELEYRSSINILGIQIDQKLSFTEHIRELASRTARKLACLRRVARYLDNKGCTSLYNSQIRSLMEYSPLVWSSCPPSYLRILDKIQERVQRLVNSKTQNEYPIRFQSLKHRRNVSGLCVFYKIHIKKSPHLTSLTLPPSRPAYNTRGGANNQGYGVDVPFARTEQCMRSFQPYFARLWNKVIQYFDFNTCNSMQKFKHAINIILQNHNDVF